MPTVLTPTLTKSRSIRIASAEVVSYSTNSSTVGNFKLYDCLMTFPVHLIVALWSHYGLTTPLCLSCNTAHVCSSSNRLRQRSILLAML
jgi:hypothetical protein